MYLDEKKIGEPEIKTLEPWRQLLLDAADYMEKHGHCKHTLWNDQGQVCFMGALHKATGAFSDYNYLKDNNAYMFGCEIADKFESITGIPNAVNWNNAPERTGEEVIAKMREIARS